LLTNAKLSRKIRTSYSFFTISMGHTQGNTEDASLIDLKLLSQRPPNPNPEEQEPRTELLISGELALRIYRAIAGFQERFGDKCRLPEPFSIDHQKFFDSIVKRLRENINNADTGQKRVKAFDVRAEEKPMFRQVFEGKQGRWENLAKQEDLDSKNRKSPLLEELLKRINLQIESIVACSKLRTQKIKGDTEPSKPNEFAMLDKSQLHDFLIKRLFKKQNDLDIRTDTKYYKVFLATLKNEIAPELHLHLKFTEAELNKLIEKLEPKFDRYGTIYFHELKSELVDFIIRRESQAGGKN